MDPHNHWNQVYGTRSPEQLSWHQARPELALELIAAAGVAKSAGIIDVGAGSSRLVDCLLELGYNDLTVLDLSSAALDVSRARLGARAATVRWCEADVTCFDPPRRYALWHDRALFHFLTDAGDRARYVATLRKALTPSGAAIIATFATDGPSRCSGLDVMRHDERSIGLELGPEFTLREIRRETHLTPWQSEQRFIYCRFQRQAGIEDRSA